MQLAMLRLALMDSSCLEMNFMKHPLWPAFLIVLSILAVSAFAAEDKPLVLKSQGSFFVGGDTKKIGTGQSPQDDVTVNQMYVQYQAPDGDRHVPVVMVHGCCLSSKTWETTPDGRMGWNEYFVRKGRSVYLADQVSRARSGFDPAKINAVRSGSVPPGELPNILMASIKPHGPYFDLGPRSTSLFPDEQFPSRPLDELYKQMIPDLNSTLRSRIRLGPTWRH